MKIQLSQLQKPKPTYTHHPISMAREAAKTIFFFLSLFSLCCSGTLVGFSFDTRRNSANSSPVETISFLKKNKVSPSQIRVFVADHRVLGSLLNTGISVDLYVNETDAENIRKSKDWAISWLNSHLITFSPHISISSIVVSSRPTQQNQLTLLLSTLSSIHLALKSVNLDGRVKVATEIPLSMLENSDKNYKKSIGRVLGFIRKCRSFIVVEAVMDGELSLGDQFIQLMIEKATSAATLVRNKDIVMVLNVKSSAIPSAVEVAQFTEKMMKSMGNSALITDRIYGLFAEISPMEENAQKELDREEEQIFPSSHRVLVNNDRPISQNKTTLHDSITPATTVLTTTPATNPTRTIITVPSTNPDTVLPTNPFTPISDPTATPVTVPVSTPVITVPSSNPVTPPASVPITNPVTTPVTVPNPVTNPISPPGSTPTTTPSTAPFIFPMPPPMTTSSPAASGQSWCLAKTGVLDASLQNALDYACGFGGADCSAIQPTGSCYNPNTLHDHASYAFNSYYQKNPVPSSCDFGGTAMIVNTNPSSGSCTYPSASSSSSSALNANPTNSTTIFAQPPPTDTSGSVPIQVNAQLLLAITILTYFISSQHLL